MELMSSINISIKKLKLASYSYLLLPVFIFFFGWLKLPLAILFSAFLFIPFYKFYNSNKANNTDYKVKVSSLLFFLLVILVWVGLSGAGGFGFQAHDHLKPNSIYKDLLQGGLPLKYNFEGKNYFLSTYLGYYITVPILLNPFSWKVIFFFIYIYTAIGVALSLLWLGILAKSVSPKIVFFFIFISGLEIIGFFQNNGIVASLETLFSDFLSVQPFWSNSPGKIGEMLLLFQSNTHTLFWGPQHAIAGWLCSGIFFYELMQEKDNRFSSIYIALLPFWSPFILIGLAPYYVFAALQQKFKGYFSPQIFLLLPVFGILYLFVNSIPMGSVDKGFIFDTTIPRLGYSVQLKKYLLFLFKEVFVWAIPVAFILYKKIPSREFIIFLITILCLIIIPLYSLGIYNDWSQRSTVPALFLLWLFVYKAFLVCKNFILKLSLVLLFVLGSWDSVYFITLSLKNSSISKIHNVPNFNKQKSYLGTSNEQGWPLYHSFANEESFFFKYLAKKNTSKVIKD